jgi:hypothetical protein
MTEAQEAVDRLLGEALTLAHEWWQPNDFGPSELVALATMIQREYQEVRMIEEMHKSLDK